MDQKLRPSVACSSAETSLRLNRKKARLCKFADDALRIAPGVDKVRTARTRTWGCCFLGLGVVGAALCTTGLEARFWPWRLTIFGVQNGLIFLSRLLQATARTTARTTMSSFKHIRIHTYTNTNVLCVRTTRPPLAHHSPTTRPPLAHLPLPHRAHRAHRPCQIRTDLKSPVR